MMKIALLSNSIYPYSTGGIQKHSFCLAKYLARKKVYVDIYTSYSGANDIKDFLTDDELNYITFINIPFPKLFRIPGHYVLASWLFSKTIFKIINQSKEYDAIYAQGFTSWCLLKKGSEAIKRKTIANLHGLEMFQDAANTKVKIQQFFLRIPAKSIIKNSDWLISLGGKLSSILTYNGAKDEVVIEIPNGLEDAWLSKNIDLQNNSKQRKFVFIGRYERRKGVEELTELIKNKNNFLSAEFHFVGPIPDEKRLQKENVFYHGLVKETDKIKAILEKSDVLICASHSEGMPTVILEAMACYCAIIATDVGAVSLQVDDNNGWLIPPKDKAALEKAIDEAIAITDEQLISKKRASQKRLEESFLWEHVSNEHIALFEQISKKV